MTGDDLAGDDLAGDGLAGALERLAAGLPGRTAVGVAPVSGRDVAAHRRAATAAAAQAIQRLGVTPTRAGGSPRHAAGDDAAGHDAAGDAAAGDDAAGDAAAGHDADGRRRWPAGLTGSVAHGHGWAVVLVARADRAGGIRGVGIDLERARALPAADAHLVLTTAERAWVASSADPDDAATMLWCCKEAAFKAWSNTAGGLVGVEPDQVEIGVDASVHVWSAVAGGTLRAQVGRDPTIRGQIARIGPLLLSVCAIGG